MRKFLPALLLLILVVAVPSEAFAQRGQRNSVELTPFVGFRFGNSLDVTVDDGIGGSMVETVKLKDGISYGFIIDVPVTDYISIEGLYSYQSADIKVGSGLDIGKGSMTYIHGGALFNLNPYSRGAKYFLALTMGVGTANASDLPMAESQSNFSFGFGAGLKVPVSKSIAFRGEFRGFSTKTDLTSLGWICGWYTCGVVETRQYLWQGEIRAGLQIGF